MLHIHTPQPVSNLPFLAPSCHQGFNYLPPPGLPTTFLLFKPSSSLNVPAQMPSSLTTIWYQYELMAIFGKHDLLSSYIILHIVFFFFFRITLEGS